MPGKREITSGQARRDRDGRGAAAAVKFTFARERETYNIVGVTIGARGDRSQEASSADISFSRDHENKFLTVTRESLKRPGRTSGKGGLASTRSREVAFENNFVYEKRQDRSRSLL